jgi:hypothetical protein
MSFSPAVRALFTRWEKTDLLGKLEASHQQFLDRRRNAVDVGFFDEPRKHAASNCFVLQQVLLHRAERLLASAGTLILENNPYGLALLARSQVEGTAVMGYVCNRLESLKLGHINLNDFAWHIGAMVVGSRNPQLERLTNAPRPPNSNYSPRYAG